MRVHSSHKQKRYNKATLYTIDNEYIKKLKSIDYRVQNNYNGQRLYVKTDLQVAEGIYYYAPLSSPKESQKAITNQSVFKMYGDKEKEDFLGVVHINNMIPVPNFLVKEWSPSDYKDVDERYIILVVKQAKYIKAHVDEINSSCVLLRNSKIGNIDPTYFKENRKEIMLYKKIVNDVLSLEEVSKKEAKGHKMSQNGFVLEWGYKDGKTKKI